ncbi:tryptophan synthase subunit alpha [Acidocella aminolytica]|jgi:tryptophan synthase alpha chain|uniref:Tryptophan synthase alpha chain n=1 Tax=Acidocella aminolytica 101 = DSM 11237 TaxID=1120923 RepID=A0A0D6PEZ8_9PROT|nr:tryptophan synthase subunit alpha [Acidocella aminolytica]GAN80325.1 tryptophan synthase subunit alpha [Acidocella aminolytica 101 = DSM 11237]GBQ33393.1 tryptophan synthase subunit alpha [Acidocella aminolytica 101 = DSM 11237]SHF49062.1 tryptophan synthase, alpha chain [Acidocella aminolytica 101 = DSM 11237]
MSRIAGVFAALRQEGRGALIPFVEAFDPDRATSLTLLKGMAENGADIIEIGMPFTDPMADGPTIQAAGRRGLQAGATLNGVLELVTEFRKENDHTPLVLMGYLNPILSHGVEAFCFDAAKAGVDGLIIVDLPAEEADLVLPYAKENKLDVIRLIAPTTSDERLRHVLAGSSGFIYYVSITGVTGTRTASAADLARDIPRIRTETDLPIAVGFGVRTPDQAATVVAHADAAIVASALIDTLCKENAEAVIRDVRALADAVRGVRKAA